VTITEGIITQAEETSTEAAIGMAVVGCLLILLGAICPLALFRLLAFVDPGTSSGAALRSSLAASGGILGALQKAGGGRAAVAPAAAGAASGGVAASGAAARLAGDRAQGESTADAATSGRFAGALRALSTGTSQAGRLAAGVAASASDVLSGAGVGHGHPYYGPSLPAPARGNGHPGGTVTSGGHGRGRRPDDGGPQRPGAARTTENGHAHYPGGSPSAAWPAERLDGMAPDRPGESDPIGPDQDDAR
jgi:type IV secretion system protein TrbL